MKKDMALGSKHAKVRIRRIALSQPKMWTCPGSKASIVGRRSSSGSQSLEPRYPSIANTPLGVNNSGSRRVNAIATCRRLRHSLLFSGGRSPRSVRLTQPKRYVQCRIDLFLGSLGRYFSSRIGCSSRQSVRNARAASRIYA